MRNRLESLFSAATLESLLEQSRTVTPPPPVAVGEVSDAVDIANPLELFFPLDVLIARLEEQLRAQRKNFTDVAQSPEQLDIVAPGIRQREAFLADLRARYAKGDREIWLAMYPPKVEDDFLHGLSDDSEPDQDKDLPF